MIVWSCHEGLIDPVNSPWLWLTLSSMLLGYVEWTLLLQVMSCVLFRIWQYVLC